MSCHFYLVLFQAQGWYSEDCLCKERVMSHELCVRHLYSGCRGNCHGSDLLNESHRN